MFCPGCGLEDRNANQYCRACGTDLRPVRYALEKPDTITASAASARDEIGRSIADKIRGANSAEELAVIAENVLPEVEKFLESPEERRMRRIRTGTIISSIGAGTAIAFFLIAMMVDKGLFVMAGLGLVCFFIGLGFLINGLVFSIPKKSLSDKSDDAIKQLELDAQNTTNELILPESNQIFSSVTEHTTQHLKEKQSVSRD